MVITIATPHGVFFPLLHHSNLPVIEVFYSLRDYVMLLTNAVELLQNKFIAAITHFRTAINISFFSFS